MYPVIFVKYDIWTKDFSCRTLSNARPVFMCVLSATGSIPQQACLRSTLSNCWLNKNMFDIQFSQSASLNRPSLRQHCFLPKLVRSGQGWYQQADDLLEEVKSADFIAIQADKTTDTYYILLLLLLLLYILFHTCFTCFGLNPPGMFAGIDSIAQPRTFSIVYHWIQPLSSEKTWWKSNWNSNLWHTN